MARIPVPSKVIRGFQYTVENDFTGGLKTEFTGLNFPENACTSTSNCTFFHTGAVFRRNGFDVETNGVGRAQDRTNKAISSFVWTNAGGDGNTKLFVTQVGNTLSFYNITTASTAAPLSAQLLVSSINISAFQTPTGSSSSVECQYASGNGYLFVFHPNLEPFYCIYSAGAVSAFQITVQTRDFLGVPEPGVPDTFRPLALSAEHQYNIQNQGWATGPAWSASSGDNIATVFNGGTQIHFPAGLLSITNVAAGIVGVTVGQTVTVTSNLFVFPSTNIGTLTTTGIVNSYVGTTLTINAAASNIVNQPTFGATWPGTESTIVVPTSSTGQTTAWHTAIGNYPSNSDVWWTFKNSTGVFDPTNTVNNVTVGGPAPKGRYTLNTFVQQKTAISGIAGLTDVTTNLRPKTGTWFQGRVWYAGVDDSFGPSGDEPFSTWTENIYFSQIVIGTSQFGRCYQLNDPTDETLFDILPSDGGVITIQGSGSIYKLFPITNGLIVFAANGIWFITGSTGIGFTATDYTISKISEIQSISATSYINVLGYPVFWNEEGIYSVGLESQQQGISVNSLTLNTIKQFYDVIPLQSKKFARGSYNPITGQVQWIYRSTNESDVTSRYAFDSALTFSMFSQAFYPWTLPTTGPTIHDVTYIVGPGGVSSPLPIFKYLTSAFTLGTYFFGFGEEKDNVNWKDWVVAGFPTDYTSFFVTAYKLHGDAKRKFQPMYVFMYSDNAQNTAYKFNGKWNFAISGNSGKYSVEQVIYNTVNVNNFSKLYRRHRLRGRGTVLQLQIASVSGKPFHIDGWAMEETQSSGV